MSHPDEPGLDPADEEAYRAEQDDHIHDEPADEQADDEQEEGGE